MKHGLALSSGFAIVIYRAETSTSIICNDNYDIVETVTVQWSMVKEFIHLHVSPENLHDIQRSLPLQSSHPQEYWANS